MSRSILSGSSNRFAHLVSQDDGVSVPFAACAKLPRAASVLVFRPFEQQLGVYSAEWQRRF